MIIGLTGGIGSGKSIVAKLFETLNCAVFNSDEVAKNVYFDEEIKKQVIILLGEEAYKSERGINKSYISSKIFSDTALLHKLNEIIHPAVKKKFEEFKNNNSNKIIVKETALLFEAKLDKLVDKIVVVSSHDKLRVERVMKRDGLSEQEVMNKIKSQLAQEDKIRQADYVIYNNEEEFLITQVLGVYNELKK